MTKSMGFAGIWNGFQNEKFEIRRGATPQLFIFQSSVFILPGSALSRGRKAVFSTRSILHSAKGRISLQSKNWGAARNATAR
jgi:hypothetical protein